MDRRKMMTTPAVYYRDSWGASEHNLKNINVDIPRDEFVVLTGLSRLR